jgi:hypothetical protein
MNARRWAAVQPRGTVMMRPPSAAVGVMPPTLAPAGSATRARARELVAGAWSVPRCEGKRKSASKEAPKMLHLLWVLPLVAGLAARGGES